MTQAASARPDCPLCGLTAPPLASLQQCDVALSENQGCPGWCVLILREHAEHMDELPPERQLAIFAEVARVAAAVRRVFPASGPHARPPRINYECLGNQVAHIHWHVIPRHADDPDPRNAVWGWDAARLKGTMNDAERKGLARRIGEALQIKD